MTEPLAVSKRFDTPIYDLLKPQHKKLVELYCVLLDKRASAIAAGYVQNNNFEDKLKSLFEDPHIITAIDEFLACKLEQLDSGRAAICERLMNQSLATIWDVAERVPYVNGNGVSVPGKFGFQPKDPSEIEPRFWCATTFVIRQADGSWGWDNMGQHRATKQLAELMMWDQSLLNTDPPLIFNFGEIQTTAYITPGEGQDLAAVTTTKDELDEFTH